MWFEEKRAEVSELIGKTLVSVENDGDTLITFKTSDGEIYIMFHSQDCCEDVRIEDINGDLADLVGVPVLLADQNESPEGFEQLWSAGLSDEEKYRMDSYTWTFYRFATIKGYVNIRWFGESNGNYSESVDFIKIDSNGN